MMSTDVTNAEFTQKQKVKVNKLLKEADDRCIAEKITELLEEEITTPDGFCELTYERKDDGKNLRLSIAKNKKKGTLWAEIREDKKEGGSVSIGNSVTVFSSLTRDGTRFVTGYIAGQWTKWLDGILTEQKLADFGMLRNSGKPRFELSRRVP